MKITRETVNAVVEEMKQKGQGEEEIEEYFKDALRFKTIDIDIYSMAMEKIYE